METPNIQNFTPDDILRKEPFKRAVPSLYIDQCGLPPVNGGYDASYDSLQFSNPSQADFMREYDVNSHKINSIKYYPDPVDKNKEGKYFKKVKTRMAFAFQQVIHTKRVNCLTGNNTNIRITNSSFRKDEGKSQELLDAFREYWTVKNVEIAIHDMISADGKVGDAALCFHLHNGKMGWRLMSFDKGDILYPHYDQMTGEMSLFGRFYSVIDKKGDRRAYLDVWDSINYCRYSQSKEGDEGFNGESKWLINAAPVRHGFTEIPIVYSRYGEPFWANSQDLIDKFESNMSQLAENNMAYALRILYSLGGDMELHTTIDGTPTQVISPDPNAKIGYLEPSDASGSFGLEIKVLDENIYRQSFAVKTPELKSGSDLSSLTVKMLFADAFQKGQEDAKKYQLSLDKIVELVKYGMGVERNAMSDMQSFVVKAELFPYVFLSETEEVANMMQLKSAGGLSRRTLAEETYLLGYGRLDEYDRLLQEEHDALLGVTATQTTAQGEPQTSRNAVNDFRNNQ